MLSIPGASDGSTLGGGFTKNSGAHTRGGASSPRGTEEREQWTGNMVEKVESEYDEDPLDPPPEDGEEPEKTEEEKRQEEELRNSDKGELLGDIPEAGMLRDKPDSYNEDPEQSGGGGEEEEKPDPAEHIFVNLAALRGAETEMLESTRIAVNKYEEVRAKVLAQMDTVFGQQLEEVGKENKWAGPTPQDAGTEPNPFQEPGKEFASLMNPLQMKALANIGGLLGTVGRYLVLINTAGQSYGQADRSSNFPDPPPNK